MSHEHFRRSLLVVALLSAGIAMPWAQAATPSQSAPATTPAASTAPANGTSLASGDRKFLEKAAQGGAAEVALGKLAAQKGESAEVKQFGQKMADDHGKANAELQQLASRKGVNLPTDMDKSSQREYDKLQKLSGADFDREYMKTMVSDHKKDVKEFQSEAKSAKDADIKGFADKTLPTLEEHLKLAQNDQAAVNNQRASSPAGAQRSAASMGQKG